MVDFPQPAGLIMASNLALMGPVRAPKAARLVGLKSEVWPSFRARGDVTCPGSGPGRRGEAQHGRIG